MQTMEVLDEPIVIEREWARQVGHSRKDDQPEPVAATLADEILQHLRGDVIARDALLRPAHVQRHHGPRQVQHEHDIDAAGLCLGMVIGEARPGQRNDAQRHRKNSQKQQESACRGSRGGAGGPSDVGAGKAQRSELADAPAEESVDRQQRQQRQQPRVLELEVARHDGRGGNPKPEGRNPKEIRRPKSEGRNGGEWQKPAAPDPVRVSDFGLPSGLGFRISDFIF